MYPKSKQSLFWLMSAGMTCGLFSTTLHAAPYTIFTSDTLAHTVCIVEPGTQVTTFVPNPFGFGELRDIASSVDNQSVAYVADSLIDNAWQMSISQPTLVTGQIGGLPTTPITTMTIAPAGQSIGYVANLSPAIVSCVNLNTNQVIATVTNSNPSGFVHPSSIALDYGCDFAYVVDKGDITTTPKIFIVDPSTNTSTHSVTGTFTSPQAVAISLSTNIAYVTDGSTVQCIDTSTHTVTGSVTVSGTAPAFVGPVGVAINPAGERACVTDPPSGRVYFINTATNEAYIAFDNLTNNTKAEAQVVFSPDGKFAFVAGGDKGLWQIDVTNNQLTQVVGQRQAPTISGVYSAASVGIGPAIVSSYGLMGNDLIVAQNLNTCAPYSTIKLLAPLQGNNLTQALRSAAPTRHGLSTYAAQNTQLSLSRLVNNHMGQNRWSRHLRPSTSHQTAMCENKITAWATQADNITRDPNDCHHDICPGPISELKTPISLWTGAFGEYTRGEPGPQTPNFHTATGGIVAACDYNGVYPHPIGMGVAYAHTYLHKDENAGHDTIDQGNVFIYSAFPIANWYLDAIMSGGYYHSKNIRNISFTGHSSKATAKTLGWQLAPHLEAGYDCWIDWLGLEPFIMGDYVACWEDHAKEFGSTPFKYGHKSRYCSLVRSEAGLRIQEVLSYSWGTMTVMEKAGYAYQKAFNTGRITAFLIGSSNLFTTMTLNKAVNMGVGELALLLAPKSKICYASLNAHIEAGSSYQAYQGSLELGKDF